MNAADIKIKTLKDHAYAIAQSLGLHISKVMHFKSRGLTVGLDLRCKSSWLRLIDRLNELKNSVVVNLLKEQPIAV